MYNLEKPSKMKNELFQPINYNNFVTKRFCNHFIQKFCNHFITGCIIYRYCNYFYYFCHYTYNL